MRALRGGRSLPFQGQDPVKVASSLVSGPHPLPELAATAVREGHVWIMRDGRLHRQAVQTGFSGETRTEIISGLGDDDTLVIGPMARLTEGRRARLSNRRQERSQE